MKTFTKQFQVAKVERQVYVGGKSSYKTMNEIIVSVIEDAEALAVAPLIGQGGWINSNGLFETGAGGTGEGYSVVSGGEYEGNQAVRAEGGNGNSFSSVSKPVAFPEGQFLLSFRFKLENVSAGMNNRTLGITQGGNQVFQFSAAQGAPHEDSAVPWMYAWGHESAVAYTFNNRIGGALSQGDWHYGEIEKMADGKYRARMDGGDWSIPENPMPTGEYPWSGAPNYATPDAIRSHQTTGVVGEFQWLDIIELTDTPLADTAIPFTCYLRPTNPEEAAVNGIQWGKSFDIITEVGEELKIGDRITIPSTTTPVVSFEPTFVLPFTELNGTHYAYVGVKVIGGSGGVEVKATGHTGAVISTILSFDCAGGTRLFAFCQSQGGAQTVTGATYNGVAMTEVVTQQRNGDTVNSLWMIENPDAGVHDIEFTGNLERASVIAISVSNELGIGTGEGKEGTAVPTGTSLGDGSELPADLFIASLCEDSNPGLVLLTFSPTLAFEPTNIEVVGSVVAPYNRAFLQYAYGSAEQYIVRGKAKHNRGGATQYVKYTVELISNKIS